jgi:RNA polymerase sigma-70 factor (ECF subfamily)
MNQVDDWDLVARAQAGDSRAFAALVDRHQGAVVGFCRRMTGSVHDAEDLAQEAFVRLYRHLGRLTPQAKFTTVLFGIARNLALNHLRDAKRRGRDTSSALDGLPLAAPQQGEPDHLARVQEIGRMLERCMAQLAVDHREVLVLREIQGLDYDSIADVLKCRKGTVKSRLARARDQLRLRMEAMGGQDL